MRRLFAVAFLLTSFALAQSSPSPQLEGVIRKMNETAAAFRSAQANFEWDGYEKVINEVDEIQYGTVYYRRAGNEIEMKADVAKPAAKEVLFSGGKIQFYIPNTNQLNIYSVGKNRQEIESYFVLGFGGSGDEMLKQFDVTYQGTEIVNGLQTEKLHLIPKADSVKRNISEIILWIDPQRGVSVQQQFFEPQGNYRLAKYSDIKLNEKIKGDVFAIKTNGNTQTFSH